MLDKLELKILESKEFTSEEKLTLLRITEFYLATLKSSKSDKTFDFDVKDSWGQGIEKSPADLCKEALSSISSHPENESIY